MKLYFKPLLISSVVGFAVSMTACSNASSADQTQTAAVELSAGNWDIQSKDSHIRFSAKQEGDVFTGAFQAFSGVIKFDLDALQDAAVQITIPLKSVDAGSNDRNSTLPGKIWFSTKTFPDAVYSSSDISVDGDGYIAKGELTLKGVSVPLALPFTLDINGDVAVMTSSIDLDRTAWNVGAAPWDTDEWVSRAVTLDIKVTAQKLN